MCEKCSASVAHLKVPNAYKVKFTDEEKASLPGKEWSGPRELLTQEQLEETRVYRRAYERVYRRKRKEADGNLREYQRGYHRAYTMNHPEVIKERSKANYEKGKERYFANERRRRALEAKVYSEKYTTTDIINRWGTNCHLCEEQIDLDAPKTIHQGENWQKGLHLDHVVPIVNGGPDILENVKPAHAACNLSRAKQGLDLEGLLASLDAKVSNMMFVQDQNSTPKLGRPLKD